LGNKSIQDFSLCQRADWVERLRGKELNGMTRTVREEARPEKVWCVPLLHGNRALLLTSYAETTFAISDQEQRPPRNFPQENHTLPQNPSTNPKYLPNTSSSGRKRTKLYQELFVRS
jgi:hypothetical protein